MRDKAPVAHRLNHVSCRMANEALHARQRTGPVAVFYAGCQSAVAKTRSQR
jgi:hypothetical protein